MYLLIAVINNEDLLDDLITGWIDIGITGATVMESTDLLQLISYHIPIFAGFRSIGGGGMRHNKTLIVGLEQESLLNDAVAYLEKVCEDTRKPSQGVYFVVPLQRFGRLGADMDEVERRRHLEKKTGRG